MNSSLWRSIGTCFLGGGGVLVAKMLALYAFDRSYTPPSQDKAGFTYPAQCDTVHREKSDFLTL